MTQPIVSVCIAALALYILFFVVRVFIKGMILSIVGLIFGLIFLVHVLRAYGIVNF